MEAKTNNFLHPGIEFLKWKKSWKKIRFSTELLFSYTAISNSCHDSDSSVSIKQVNINT